MKRGGRVSGRVWSFHDVTLQRRAEKTLRAALQEKEVLLREVHHRVKNNMQVINSLLTLEAERVGNESVRQAIIESQQRIVAMSMIHEVLYRSQHFALGGMGDVALRWSSDVMFAAFFI